MLRFASCVTGGKTMAESPFLKVVIATGAWEPEAYPQLSGSLDWMKMFDMRPRRDGQTSPSQDEALPRSLS